MNKFDFDFENSFYKNAEYCFESSMKVVEQYIKDNPNSEIDAFLLKEIFNASISTSRKILEEYHTELNHYLDKKLLNL